MKKGLLICLCLLCLCGCSNNKTDKEKINTKEEKEFFLNKKIYTNLFSVCISALIMCIAIIFIKHIIKNNFLLIVISVISGIIIYSICLFIMKNKTFIEYINSLKHKK